MNNSKPRPLSDLERFMMGKFNFITEVGPAKLDRVIELGMVSKLLSDPGNTFSFDELGEAVHNLVHVDKHYFVTDGPAKDLRDLYGAA